MYNIWLPDSEVDSHQQKGGLSWAVHQHYVTLYLTMDDVADLSALLPDHSVQGIDGLMIGGTTFLEVTIIPHFIIHLSVILSNTSKEQLTF